MVSIQVLGEYELNFGVVGLIPEIPLLTEKF